MNSFNNFSNQNYFSNFLFQKKFLQKTNDSTSLKFFKNQKKFTIKYGKLLFIQNNSTDGTLFSNVVNAKKNSKNPVLVKNTNLDIKFNERLISKLFKNFKFQPTNNYFKTNMFWSLFDINFLKKEKIYTKLKYSRVPQYDIVSGGVAALFAGFLGFLICEKFGFELLDSGDFYMLFMYVVFFSFCSRLFFKTMTLQNSSWNNLSTKWILNFYKNLFFLFLNFFKNLLL